MLISLPANTDMPALAAQKWLRRIRGGMLVELDSWARSMELDWGQCRIFLEVVLPVPDTRRGEMRHTQIDLLVTFGDRVALCEVKCRNPKTFVETEVDGWARQIAGQLELAQMWALNYGWAKRRVLPFIFVVGLNETALDAIDLRLQNTLGDHHIRVMGAEARLRSKTTGSNRPLFLTEALTARLLTVGTGASNRPNSATPAGRPSVDLGDAFEAILKKGGAKLADFAGLLPLTQHLQLFYDALPKRFVPPPWHIPDLRGPSRAAANLLFADRGLLEIVGPPGIGKSSFAQDVIEGWLALHPMYSACEIALRDCRKLEDVVFALAEMLIEQSRGLDVNRLTAEIVVGRHVIWIKDYDAASRGAVQHFLTLLLHSYQAGAGSPIPQARWLVETHRGFESMGPYRLNLPGMTPTELARILAGSSSGGAYAVPEDVISLAHGNPRFALTLWQSGTASRLSGPDTDQFRWFLDQLPDPEAKVLPQICLIASMCPIGLPVASVLSWVRSSCTALLPDDAAEAGKRVLLKLKAAQLVRLEALDAIAKELFDGDEIGSFEVLRTIDTGLTETVLSTKREDDKIRWRQQVSDYLLDRLNHGSSEYDILGVTLAIHVGDLEPFFRSSFRRTAVHSLILWLDRTGFAEQLIPGTQQFVLYRALQLIDKLHTEHSLSLLDVAKVLESPNNDTPSMHYVRQVVRGYAVVGTRGQSIDLDSWSNEALAEQNCDLRAEMLVRLAIARATSGEHEVAWRTTRDLSECAGLNGATESLVLVHALAQLNRQKVSLKGLDAKDERSPLIRRYARRLFELGFKAGNVSTISNALFYYVRDVEYHLGRAGFDPLNYERLLSCLGTLEFVERTTMARRMQAILTQGSIHRHCCRWDGITWEEFQEHMKAARILYSRAFGSALPSGQLTFALNSASYLVDLCTKALRFSTEPSAWVAIVTHCQKTVEVAALFRKAFSADELVGDQKRIDGIVERAIPLLEFVIAIDDTRVDHAVNERVADRLRDLAEQVTDLIAMTTSPRRDSFGSKSELPDLISETLRLANRAMVFAQHRGTHNRDLLKMAQTDFQTLLRVTDFFAHIGGNGRLLKEWDRLRSSLK